MVLNLSQARLKEPHVKAEFMAALGPPPPDLQATADALDIALEELQTALAEAGVQLGRP